MIPFHSLYDQKEVDLEHIQYFIERGALYNIVNKEKIERDVTIFNLTHFIGFVHDKVR